MASVTKPPIDCTVLNHGLPRRCAPRRDSIVKLAEKCPVIANTTPSLRTLISSLRAQRSNPPRKPHGAQPWTATAFGLAETCFNGLPRRYAPRRDSSASLRTLPVFANATPSLRAQRSNPSIKPREASLPVTKKAL
jgi:hypothetical protein